MNKVANNTKQCYPKIKSAIMRPFLLLFFSLTLSLPINGIAQNTDVDVESGVCNLSAFNFEHSASVRIISNWEFYWSKLLKPDDFYIGKKPQKSGIIKLPSLWNGYQLNNIELSGDGYATFRLLLYAPQLKGKEVRIRLGRVETAYRLFADNELIAFAGEVGTDPYSTKAAWIPREGEFTPKTETTQLLLQISNFKHRKGGVTSNISVGLKENIVSETARLISIDVFLIGVLLIMAMHHFGLFGLRIKDRTTLYFGLMCLTVAASVPLSSQLIIVRIFPNFSWEWFVKLNFITNYFSLAAFTMFLSYSFPERISLTVARAVAAWSIIMTIFLILTPARVNTHSLLFFELVTLSVFVYLVYGMLKAHTAKIDGAGAAFWGTFFLAIAAVNDILADAHVINTLKLTPIGIFIFIFFQSFMLSIRSSRSYTAVERLSTQLMSLDKIKNEFLALSGYKMSTPLKVVVNNIGAQKGYLILNRNNDWYVEAEAFQGNSEPKAILNVLLSDIAKSNSPIFSVKAVEQVIETKDSLLLYNAKENEFFKMDEYIAKNHVLSLICMPLMKAGKLKGVIYLENNIKQNAFDEETENILDLLSSQTSSLIDNASMFTELEDLNKNLENKVSERTAEVMLQKEEIEAQRDEIERSNQHLQQTLSELSVKNRDLTDSINYSKRIQESILTDEEVVKTLFPESFILFKPRDVLSGDFYWIEQVFVEARAGGMKTEKVLIAAVDCTGHGVPGALMSIIANNLLNHAVHELGVTQPSQILDIIQDGISTRLRKQDGRATQDGMDISLVSYERATKRLEFAGAKNPLVIISKGELTEIRGDKFSIGGLNRKTKGGFMQFTNHEIKIEGNEQLYLFSDGYPDQFGGPNERKFMKKKFKELLLKNHIESTEKQKEILETNLEDWKSGLQQLDDILIIGIRL